MYMEGDNDLRFQVCVDRDQDGDSEDDDIDGDLKM